MKINITLLVTLGILVVGTGAQPTTPAASVSNRPSMSDQNFSRSQLGEVCTEVLNNGYENGHGRVLGIRWANMNWMMNSMSTKVLDGRRMASMDPRAWDSYQRCMQSFHDALPSLPAFYLMHRTDHDGVRKIASAIPNLIPQAREAFRWLKESNLFGNQNMHVDLPSISNQHKLLVLRLTRTEWRVPIYMKYPHQNVRKKTPRFELQWKKELFNPMIGTLLAARIAHSTRTWWGSEFSQLEDVYEACTKMIKQMEESATHRRKTLSPFWRTRLLPMLEWIRQYFKTGQLTIPNHSYPQHGAVGREARTSFQDIETILGGALHVLSESDRHFVWQSIPLIQRMEDVAFAVEGKVGEFMEDLKYDALSGQFSDLEFLGNVLRE